MRDSYADLSIHRIIDGFWATSGTLKQAGDVLYLIAPGSASGVIEFIGTFTNAVVEILGAATTDAQYIGPRMVYQSGIGSTGSNVHVLLGGVDTFEEVRIVTGGFGVMVRLVSIDSGTLSIEMSASVAPNVVFGNGPFHNAEEQAVRDGRAYLSTSGIVPVTSGNILHCTIENPADSGVYYYITERRFSNSSADVLEYLAYRNPTAVLAETGISRNRNFTSDAVATGVFKYQVAAAGSITMGGLTGSGEQVAPESVTTRPLLSVIGPGDKLGFTITGAGSNLQNTARLSVTLEWYEERI